MSGFATSLSRIKKQEKKNKRERCVILGMLINIHELSSLASIFKMTGLLPTVSSKLESAIVKERRRASLCFINFLSKHMIRYWSFVIGCRLDRILSSQRPMLPSITSLSSFFPSPVFPRWETWSKSTLWVAWDQIQTKKLTSDFKAWSQATLWATPVSNEYTTSIKQPRFGNLSKFLPIVLMKISSPDSDLALKH